ncbi:hypothetical protein SNE40_022113 [Patella caerulea]|uniref:Phytanoyl-CoA dioxygenase n=1 Tax=Patella caerulea TaxID=87958 RepID=A0AAN8G1Q1_PATCE
MSQTEYRPNQNNEVEVTEDMKKAFDKHGYIMVRNLLNSQELEKLKMSLDENETISENSHKVDDGEKRFACLTVWSHPGDDVTGMISRSEKVAGTCEQLLEGEVYHYHSKLMMKVAKVGGRWAWHQDYGYWYGNTPLFPDMMTVFIAVDGCHQGNGCLEILDGSHKCGRIEHNFVGQLMGADMDRVNMIEKRCPKKFVEMNPGDGLFFHCNLLHYSGPNLSEERRWAFLIAYNKASNDPVEEHHHPKYTPLHKVPNSAILNCEVLWDTNGKSILTKEKRQQSKLAEINVKN